MTDRELEEYSEFMSHNLIPNLIRFADKHNIDRDSIIKYTADMLEAMAELSTFSYYKSEVQDADSN